MIANEPVRIRDPHERDLAPMVRLYNHYVETSHVTFDIEPRTLADRRVWLRGFSQTGPHRLLVAECGTGVVGYASSSQFRHKAAYQTSVETAVYVAPEFTTKGVGGRLYAALLEYLCEHENVHYAYAGIALPNPASVGLHEKLGFEFIGTFREVGYKFGKFWSVSWYQMACR